MPAPKESAKKAAVKKPAVKTTAVAAGSSAKFRAKIPLGGKTATGIEVAGVEGGDIVDVEVASVAQLREGRRT